MFKGFKKTNAESLQRVLVPGRNENFIFNKKTQALNVPKLGFISEKIHIKGAQK